MTKTKDDGDVLRLLDRLPFLGAVARDVTALRALLVDRRMPRVVVVGASGVGKTSLANALLRADALPLLPGGGGSSTAAGETATPPVETTHGTWITVRGGGRALGWLELVPGALDESARLEHALAAHGADVVLVVLAATASPEEVSRTIEAAKTTVERVAKLTEVRPPLRVVVTGADRLTLPEAFATPPYPADAVAKLEANLAMVKRELERAGLRDVPAPIACAAPWSFADRDRTYNVEALADVLYAALPEAARLEGARAFPVGLEEKRSLARAIIQHTSSVAVTIGLAPIPFADAFLLMPLQALLVTSIAYVSGLPWDRRAALEFITSLGLTGGAAFGLRLGAQQLIKVLPGAGSLISGSFAGAGTLALGRSAVAYFIDGPGQRAPASLVASAPQS